MAYDQKILDQLAANPAETLSVELKGWLDPNAPEGIAKIVKACLALWNINGGYLLIGFNDDGKPSPDGIPVDPVKTYHPDVIQGLICKYASYPFEVATGFVERDGVHRPVVCIASGVRIPVAAKCELSLGGKPLIRDHAIYVRSLKANNRASTSEARRDDWGRLMEVWMDNREADVARFMRRHLSDQNLSKFRKALFGNNPTGEVKTRQSISSESNSLETEAVLAANSDEGPWLVQSNFRQDGLNGALKRGAEAFNAIVTERSLKLPEHGSFEAAVFVWGDMKKYSSNDSFLNLIMSSNPRYTGWPFWLDTRSLRDSTSRPYFSNGGVQALFVAVERTWQDTVDFWRAEPEGVFYHRRALEDDVKARIGNVEPFTVLDWSLMLWRVGEVIGTGLAFARAMGCTAQITQVGFAFRWTRLKGRVLHSWSEPGRSLMPLGSAHDDSLIRNVTVPLETADTSIFMYVHEATKPLFELFGGKEIQPQLVESVIARMFSRQG